MKKAIVLIAIAIVGIVTEVWAEEFIVGKDQREGVCVIAPREKNAVIYIHAYLQENMGYEIQQTTQSIQITTMPNGVTVVKTFWDAKITVWDWKWIGDRLISTPRDERVALFSEPDIFNERCVTAAKKILPENIKKVLGYK